MPPSKTKFLADLAERVIWTFVQSFAAAWVILPGYNADVLYIAATAALVAVAKCLVATQVGADNTAATLPETTDTERGVSDMGALACVLLIALVLILIFGFGVG